MTQCIHLRYHIQFRGKEKEKSSLSGKIHRCLNLIMFFSFFLGQSDFSSVRTSEKWISRDHFWWQHKKKLFMTYFLSLFFAISRGILYVMWNRDIESCWKLFERVTIRQPTVCMLCALWNRQILDFVHPRISSDPTLSSAFFSHHVQSFQGKTTSFLWLLHFSVSFFFLPSFPLTFDGF